MDTNYYYDGETEQESLLRFEAIDKMVKDYDDGLPLSDILQNQSDYYPPVNLFTEDQIQLFRQAEEIGMAKEKLAYLLKYGNVYRNRFEEMHHSLSLVQIAEEQIQNFIYLCQTETDLPKYQEMIKGQQHIIDSEYHNLLNIRGYESMSPASRHSTLSEIYKPTSTYQTGTYSLEELLSFKESVLPPHKQEQYNHYAESGYYNENKLREIHIGLEKDLDIRLYTNRFLSEAAMHEIRVLLENIKEAERHYYLSVMLNKGLQQEHLFINDVKDARKKVVEALDKNNLGLLIKSYNQEQVFSTLEEVASIYKAKVDDYVATFGPLEDDELVQLANDMIDGKEIPVPEKFLPKQEETSKEFIESGFVKGYSEEQLLEIQKGEDAGIDTSIYINAEYSAETMKMAREKLEYIKAQEVKLNNVTNLGKSTNLLNENQKALANDLRNRIARKQKELIELLPDLDASKFLKADFDVPVVSKETADMVIENIAKLKAMNVYDEEQLAVLRDGLSLNHNIAIYCKPTFSADTMKELQKTVSEIMDTEAEIQEVRALPPTVENNNQLFRLEYFLDGLWLDALPMNAKPELKQSHFLEDTTMELLTEIAQQPKKPLLSAGSPDVNKMSLDEVLHELHTLNEHVNLSLTVMKDEINTLQRAKEVETDYKETADTILEAYRIFDDTEYSLKKNKAELQQNATKILSGLHKNSAGIAPEVVSAVEEAYLVSEKLLDEAIKHIKELSLQLELQTEETSESIVSVIKEKKDNAITEIKEKLAFLSARAQLLSSHAYDKEADIYRKTGRVLKNISKHITNVDKTIFEGKLRLKNAVHALKGESTEHPSYVASGLARKVCSFLEGCYQNQFELALSSQEKADQLKTKSSLILLEKGNSSKKSDTEEEDLDKGRENHPLSL